MSHTLTLNDDNEMRVVRLALESYSADTTGAVPVPDRNTATMLAARLPWVPSGKPAA